MFGQNPKLGSIAEKNGTILDVHSIFSTIQGEGPAAGTPAVFVRLHGCNLACYFCDTQFSDVLLPLSLPEIVLEVEKVRAGGLVVLTGGEPLRQNVVPLIRLLHSRDHDVQIETSGSLFVRGLEDLNFRGGARGIVCSPKLPKVHPNLAPLITAWKYIIRAGETSKDDGLPVGSTQKDGGDERIARPWDSGSADLSSIFVQPCDEGPGERTRANVEETIRVAKTFGYRLSFQIHKTLGLP